MSEEPTTPAPGTMSDEPTGSTWTRSTGSRRQKKRIPWTNAEHRNKKRIPWTNAEHRNKLLDSVNEFAALSTNPDVVDYFDIPAYDAHIKLAHNAAEHILHLSDFRGARMQDFLFRTKKDRNDNIVGSSPATTMILGARDVLKSLRVAITHVYSRKKKIEDDSVVQHLADMIDDVVHYIDCTKFN